MTFTSGPKSYFVSGSPKGFVIGPKVPGKDDHLTIGNDGDELAQVHRTVNGREDWRVTPESLQAEVDSFLANNTAPIEPSTLNASATYVISLDRVNVAFSALQSVISIPLALVLRLVTTQKFAKTENGVEGSITIDPNRVRHLVDSSRRPLAILSPLIQRFAPIVLPRVMKRIARHVLIPPNKIDSLNEDIALLISSERVGVVWQSEGGRLLFMPLTAILEAYGRMERNQPFGKLNEIVSPEIGVMEFAAKSWTT